MTLYLKDKYINLLTDFGFKRVFGTEPNKHLLVDFLNTLLPADRQVEDVIFRNNENLGNSAVDRKAIFDIYCQGVNGERFIVELQKAKQNFFKDRSTFYATFPIQEQALRGNWDFKLDPIYAVGILDFVFDEHKSSETLIHRVELKDQDCNVFYDKLKFIYIELPKFNKGLEELKSHGDKWLFILKNLAELTDRPTPLQEEVFNELFDIAEIANFSAVEQDGYQDSLKYYRDLNNVVDTSRAEGIAEGEAKGMAKGMAKGKLGLLLGMLSMKLGGISELTIVAMESLSPELLDELGKALFGFGTIADLNQWLTEHKID